MWLQRLRLKLALWLIPRGHTIASILHLNRAREAVREAQEYIAASGHLTRAYKAGKRLRDDLTTVSNELSIIDAQRIEEGETPDQAS